MDANINEGYDDIGRTTSFRVSGVEKNSVKHIKMYVRNKIVSSLNISMNVANVDVRGLCCGK